MGQPRLEEGRRYRIRTRSGLELVGTVLPRYELYDRDHVTLKLDNGYNVGIRLDNIVSVEEAPPKPPAGLTELKVEAPPENPRLPRVIILGTGGTIASKVDYETGGVKPTLTVRDILEAVPEIASIARLETQVLYNIFSEDMEPRHWSELAEKVAALLREDPRRGVIIAHGTDTMALTASALSFALRGLPAPVALVGAQRSSDRPSSDSAFNLVAATLYATGDIGEVAVVMHGETGDTYALAHRGTRVRKMHTSRRDAFQSIDSLPLARIYPNEKRVEKIRPDTRGLEDPSKLEVRPRFSEDVVLLKFYPGMKPGFIDYLADQGARGIVLEGTGLGHVANKLIPHIRRASEMGVVFVMTSQCLFGQVNMNVYSTGRRLIEAGVVSGEDMLPETAYVKLSWLLANTRSPEEARSLVARNLVGEIEERRTLDLYPRWNHG